jgi:kinesin family protein 13
MLHDLLSYMSVTANERVYLILKTTVHLSYPATMDLVLRKRLSLNIYKKQSITDRIRRKIVRSDCLNQCGVTYEVVSNIPKVCIFFYITEYNENQAVNVFLNEGNHYF